MQEPRPMPCRWTMLVAPLVFIFSAHAAIAQEPGRPGIPGRPGGPGSVGAPAQGQGQAQGQGGPPASAPGQAPPSPRPGGPAAAEAEAPPDTSPLGRYIPGDSVWLYFEFPGLNTCSDAWHQTAAHAMLNQTPLGDMLREIVGQLPAASGKPTKIPPADATIIAEHILQHGLVVASPGELSRPGGDYAILVLRNAAHKSVRAAFGKLLGQMTPEGSKPKVVDKPGGRKVVFIDRMPGSPSAPPNPSAPQPGTPGPGAPGASVIPPPAPSPDPGVSGSWSWWVEKNDLVLSLIDGNAADEIIAVLDGTRPSIVENEVLSKLRQPYGSFTPAAIGFALLDRPGASPEIRQIVDQQGLKRIDFRWGFDEKSLVSLVGLDAPTPRKGIMTVFEQPGFSPSDLPPLPPEVSNFTVLSIEPTTLFDQIGPILDLIQPGLGSGFVEKAEAASRSKTRLDLRKEFLSKIGPRIAIFQGPTPTRPTPPSPGPSNPLAGVLSSLGSLKLPEYTILVEAKNSKEVEQAVDSLIITLNDQLKTLFAPTPGPTPNQPTQGGRPGAGRGRASGGEVTSGSGNSGAQKPAAPETPKFQLTTIQPKTYTLVLPAGITALTGLTPTITMGKDHIIIATTPGAARTARLLESNPASPRWTPDSATSEILAKLPPQVMLLGYGDPTETIPQSLATLPATIQSGLGNILAGNIPGLTGPAPATLAANPSPGAGGPGPQRGEFGRGGGGGRTLVMSNSSGDGSSSGAPSADDYESSASANSSPSSTAASPGPPKPGQIRIDPAKIPTAEALRKYLFPSLVTVVVEDQGIRIESRDAFPDLSFLSVFAEGVPGLGTLSGLAGQASPAGTPSAAPGGGGGRGPGAIRD